MGGRPIVVVTGANAGVGFGICHRLVLQFSHKNAPDTRIKAGTTPENLEGPYSCADMTIVMACRNKKRAEIAREKLFGLLDAEIARQKTEPGYDGHAELFRQNLRIEVHYLDLAIMETIFNFGEELSQKYPYVSHLICNAGVASFAGVDYSVCFKQFFGSPVAAVSTPEYYIQRRGELSVDGLGWVWQCNVFGHYALYRTIQPLLLASRCSLGPRVLWTSSCTSHPKFYDPVDWQFVKSKYSYESSKYHTDLFATHLDRCSNQTTPGSKQIRHFIVDPGVVNTNLASPLLNFFTSIAFIFISYFSRLLGVSCYTITPYKAAVSAVQLSFIPLSVIPSFATFSSIDPGKQNTARTSESSQNSRPLRFCSQSNRWGKERVGVGLLQGWDDNEDSSRELLDQCEVLYQSLREAHGKTSVKGDK